MAKIFSITDLAREFEVTTRTIRYYEDKGLLTPVRDGQRRVYGPRDHVRLRLIMRGKRLGFSLDEIREMIDLYDVDATEISQLNKFLEKIRGRQRALRRHQADIAETLNELDLRETECVNLLADKSRTGVH
ncbi:MAG: MerR family DNA-binding transcriptional regulator [Rhodospirillales bacterium]|nr:MerR family DNA-binding transcriptional regulator [Rhodospirillales bacterium]